MTTAHQQRAFYDAVVARLVSQTSKNIGRAAAPASLTHPYAVVYPQGEDIDTDRDGTLADAHDSTFFEWQVTSVGSTLEQALGMVDLVRTALLGWTPVVTGVAFGLVELVNALPVLRDDDTSPPVFYGVDVFRVFST